MQRTHTVLRKLAGLLFLGLSVAGFAMPLPAQAEVNVSIGVGLPFPIAIVPSPVVVVPAPVVVERRPVIVYQPPVVVERHRVVHQHVVRPVVVERYPGYGYWHGYKPRHGHKHKFIKHWKHDDD